MAQKTSVQKEVDALDAEYRAYIESLRVPWILKNRVHSKDVYEVMSPEDRARVDGVVAAWNRYITPLGEAWWKERGFGVIWPDDDSKPIQLYKLETA